MFNSCLMAKVNGQILEGFPTEKIEDLGNCSTSMVIIIAISHMNIQFTFLHQLINHVLVARLWLPLAPWRISTPKLTEYVQISHILCKFLGV